MLLRRLTDGVPTMQWVFRAYRKTAISHTKNQKTSGFRGQATGDAITYSPYRLVDGLVDRCPYLRSLGAQSTGT